MDAYITCMNALTCLGSGNKLWDRIVNGENGLTPAYKVYPDWFPEKKNQIGTINDLNHSGSRLLQILERLGKLFTNEYFECQTILGACSLGDLNGRFAGDPFGCMSHYFATTHPELAPKFRGVVSSACSSGTDVISLASILVDQKKHDIVGVLAADCLDPGKLLQHFALGTQAETRAMPFDRNRSGTSFGEGGAFAIVANKEGLRKLNINNAFKISGFGFSCDAMHITAPDETGKNPSLAIKRSLKAANCIPDNVGYINAHASGTQLNDQVESIAYNKAFGAALNRVQISGTKGAIGHLLGSTGLVELVFACWALANSTAPGTAGLLSKDETLNIPVIKEGNTGRIDRPFALSTTFGFGGVNSAIIVEKQV